MAKALLQTFLSVGFPDELERDEAFSGLIFGGGAIPGGDDVKASFRDVLESPGAAWRADSLAKLKKKNIVPSKDALIAGVNAADVDAVMALLSLGYWDQMTQTERAALVRDANAVGDKPGAGWMISPLIKNAMDGKFSRTDARQRSA